MKDQRSLSRRSFIKGSALAATASALAFPSTAFGETSTDNVLPVPKFTIEVRKPDGTVVLSSSSEDSLALHRGSQGMSLETTSTFLQKADGVRRVDYEAKLFDSNAIKPLTITDDTQYDSVCTVTASVDYRFFRGKITVNSGTARISDIVEGGTVYNRYLVVAQGSYGSYQIVEQFFKDEHTIITNFPEINYIPSGELGMNGVNLQVLASTPTIDEHLIVAFVSV